MTGREADIADDAIEDAAVDRALEEWLQPYGVRITLSEQLGSGIVTARIPEFDIVTAGTNEAAAMDAVIDALIRFVRDALYEGRALPPRDLAYLNDEMQSGE